jgi:hypothetical protein
MNCVGCVRDRNRTEETGGSDLYVLQLYGKKEDIEIV